MPSPSFVLPIPVIRTRNPVMKKRLATARFRLRSAPISVLVLTALVLVFVLVLSLSTIRPFVNPPVLDDIPNTGQTGSRHTLTYTDPCMQVHPQQLFHFDPPNRVSREFESSAGIVPSDVDPPSFNRIFSAFFDRYLFTPHSDVVVGINATARGRPTDIRYGMTIAERAIRIISGNRKVQVDNYTLGYEHLDRVRGSRNVFHVLTRHGESDQPDTPHRFVVAIQRLFDGSCHVSVQNVSESTFTNPVYVVLPYSSRLRRLKWFLSQFEELVLESDVVANLVIAVFKENATDVEAVQKLTRNSPATKFIQTISVGGDQTSFFSRAIAIREAAKLVPQESVMFISDVDMYVFATLFDSCRYNSIRGSQVYFPVFYSLFPRNDRISKSGGYWRDSSLGMSCMYRSDFDQVAAYEDAENKFIGWGMEDRALHEAFKKADGYEVFRAIEPALRHKWHVKHCEPLTPFYEDCLAVTFQQIGDMKSVGKFMMDQQKMDAQLMFARYAEDDDFDDGRIVKAQKNETANMNKEELERLKKRQDLLRRSNEERKRRNEERQRQRDMSWRKEHGIVLTVGNKASINEMPGDKMQQDDSADEASEKLESLDKQRSGK